MNLRNEFYKALDEKLLDHATSNGYITIDEYSMWLRVRRLDHVSRPAIHDVISGAFQSVYRVSHSPELVEILAELGFEGA